MHTSLLSVIFLGLVGFAHGGVFGCPRGWTRYRRNCYVNVNAKMIQPSAQAHCRRLGGFLAEPTSAAENNVISGLSKAKVKSLGRFIGIVDKRQENKFVGETSGKPITYHNWYAPTREQNNQYNREDCVEIDFRIKGKWNDVRCNYRRLPFICQKYACPGHWKVHGNTCYSVSTERVTWSEAQERCRNLGGALAEPRTAASNWFISGLTAQAFWIGLSDLATEGTYQWDTNLAKLRSFKSWKPRQPDDWRKNEDCIESNHGGHRGKWNDNACTNRFLYVCQM